MLLKKGLAKALKMDADIIINIDTYGQYNPKEIPELIKPIIDGAVRTRIYMQ